MFERREEMNHYTRETKKRKNKRGGIHEATDRAVLEMNKFGFNKTNVTFQRTDVRFAKNLGDFDAGLDYNEGGASAPTVAKNIRFVKVTTPQLPVTASFAAMVLGQSRNM